MIELKSFCFLIFLYYFRALPVEIFWFFFAPLSRLKTLSRSLNILAPIFILLAHAIAFILIFIPVLLLLNLILESLLKQLFGMIFLISRPIREKRNRLYIFLKSPLLKKGGWRFAIENFFFSLGIFGAILAAIGGIETLNSFSAHRNPDIFDLIFSEFGSQLFFGGAFLINLSFFYIYFLSTPQSRNKWSFRRRVLRKINPLFHFFVFSNALTHPYFFPQTKKNKP